VVSPFPRKLLRVPQDRFIASCTLARRHIEERKFDARVLSARFTLWSTHAGHRDA
jgi:hypothetical protein